MVVPQLIKHTLEKNTYLKLQIIIKARFKKKRIIETAIRKYRTWFNVGICPGALVAMDFVIRWSVGLRFMAEYYIHWTVFGDYFSILLIVRRKPSRNC